MKKLFRLMLLGAAVASPAIAATSLRTGFESGLEGWKRELCCAHSAQSVSRPRREGQKALKITLNRNDPKVSGNSRAELKLGSVSLGSEYTYRFSTFIPSHYRPDLNSLEIIAQWHGRPDFSKGENWRSPPLALMVVGDNLKLYRRWDAGEVTPRGGGNPGPRGGTETIDLGSVPRNRWVDWEFQIKWHYTSQGRLEVFKDGQLIVTKRGGNTYNDAVAPYFKIGLYKPGWKDKRSAVTRRELYFDRVAVLPGRTSPPPPPEPSVSQGIPRNGQTIAFRSSANGKLVAALDSSDPLTAEGNSLGVEDFYKILDHGGNVISLKSEQTGLFLQVGSDKYIKAENRSPNQDRTKFRWIAHSTGEFSLESLRGDAGLVSTLTDGDLQAIGGNGSAVRFRYAVY